VLLHDRYFHWSLVSHVIDVQAVMKNGKLISDCYLIVHISFFSLSLTLIFLSDLHSCIV
jgi:hypothetical protein